MKTKALYIIFISLAILSVLLMAINKQCNYVINDWYISGIYIAMWFFLFLHTVGKNLEGKKKRNKYLYTKHSYIFGVSIECDICILFEALISLLKELNKLLLRLVPLGVKVGGIDTK